MIIYPAIDLVGGKAVRLYKGDYAQMTVYSDDPVSVAKDFQNRIFFRNTQWRGRAQRLP